MANKIRGVSAFTLLVIAVLALGLFPYYVEAAVNSPKKVPSLKATTNAKDVSLIKLSWGKVSNAKGYQIFRKTTDAKKWEKIVTLKSSKTKYICKGLKANTKYRFKVRAYKTYKVKGQTKKKYGKYSKVVSIKTRKSLKTIVLKEGYYTAGIDIPAGVFDVKATAGAGYLLSDIDSANLRGPEYKKGDIYDYNEYSPTFNSFRLSKGEILEIKGVQVKLTYKKLNSGSTGRKYNEQKGIKLTSGNYVVGTDINAGRYCVKYIVGEGGYVSSDRDGTCTINANMDGDPETGDYVDYVSNIVLENGEHLEVTSGLTVLFIPEK